MWQKPCAKPAGIKRGKNLCLPHSVDCHFPKYVGRLLLTWSSGAAGAQVPYKHKVGGSNPSSTTINNQGPHNGGLVVYEDTA